MRGLLLKVCNGFREKVAGLGGAERRWTHVAVLRSSVVFVCVPCARVAGCGCGSPESSELLGRCEEAVRAVMLFLRACLASLCLAMCMAAASFTCCVRLEGLCGSL